MSIPKELDPERVLQQMGDGVIPPDKLIRAGMLAALRAIGEWDASSTTRLEWIAALEGDCEQATG